MHGWTAGVHRAAIPGDEGIDPVVVDVAVEHLQPAPRPRAANIVVVPGPFVQSAHDDNIVSDTFHPTLEGENAVVIVDVKDGTAFATKAGYARRVAMSSRVKRGKSDMFSSPASRPARQISVAELGVSLHGLSSRIS